MLGAGETAGEHLNEVLVIQYGSKQVSMNYRCDLQEAIAGE